MTDKKTSKTDLILDCAALILKENGDAALSMRQIAARTGMSLSNVQYYYKDKDTLLIALADRYLGECLSLLKEYDAQPSAGNNEQQLKKLIEFFLDHVEELSDMCRMFREFWAIATRNAVINELLSNYYRQFSDLLVEVLTKISGHQKIAEKQASVIIPYIEGYSIVNNALPLDRSEISESLNRFCGLLLEDNSTASE